MEAVVYSLKNVYISMLVFFNNKNKSLLLFFYAPLFYI
jgi:hypothetical protein